MDLTKVIREVPDFPKKGILFYDITTLMANPKAFKYTLDKMIEFSTPKEPVSIIGIEARGFIYGAAVADRMSLPFVPIRKKGKLPSKTHSIEYDLEYGTDRIEIHADAIKPGDKVIVVDDLIATGGTLEAACRLVEKCGGVVAGIASVIDLAFLPWREKLGKYDVLYMVSYNSEQVD